MLRIKKIKGLGEKEPTPRPCEYFDIIGGTSTGGYLMFFFSKVSCEAC